MKRIISFFKKFYQEILIILFFLIVAIIYTYPLFFRLNEVVWGYVGDNFGAIWYVWWLKYSSLKGLPSDFTNLVNFPFGLKIDASSNIEPIWQLFLQYFGFLLGEIFTFNFLIFLSFPLSAITMYALIHYLTKDKLAATLVAIVYMLLPYHFWQSYQHVALSQIQWLPLYVLALLKLDSNPNFRNSLFAAVSFLLVALSSVYHGYFMVLFTISFVIFKILYKLLTERKNYLNFNRLKYFSLTLIFIILVISPFAYKFYQTRSVTSLGATEAYKRPIENLLGLSARPWDFFIPPSDHPFFGKYEHGLYAKIRTFSNDYKTISAFLPERIMYVGIPAFLLALVGIYFSLKGRRKELIIVLLGVSAFLAATAAPPFVIIKGKTIYLPSYFFYQVLPIIRVYARLGIVLDLLILLFAGFGFSFLFSKIKNKILLFGSFCLLIALFLFEFANFLQPKISDISKIPETYEWLKGQRGLVNIIEYPRTFNVAASLLYQRYHEKGIFNLSGSFASTSPYTPLWDIIENPTSSDTAKVLSALGLDYALIHVKTPYNMLNPFDEIGLSQIVEEGRWIPLRGNGISGFELASSFDDGFFVKITANPDKLIIFEEESVRFLPNSRDWLWKDSRNTLYFLNIKKQPIFINLKFDYFGFERENLKSVFRYKEDMIQKEIELKSLEGPLKINQGISSLRFEINDMGTEFGVRNISVSEFKAK